MIIAGNLGTPILSSLMKADPVDNGDIKITRYIACTRSEASEERLRKTLDHSCNNLKITRRSNIEAITESDVIILAVDPSTVEAVLTQEGVRKALQSKLLISIVAGWTREKLETTIFGYKSTSENRKDRAWVVRTLPNIAAQVAQSLTAIELSDPPLPSAYMQITEGLFERVGKTVQIEPRLMDATTALGGSTPAFFAVICDALIDAAVAVGVPRAMAHVMTFQAMQGTASLLQSGIHPALLKDQGTSPEGCTIGGLMVMEEAGVRGHIGRALREAVTIARRMDSDPHVNDTRH
jgi:pyrroline-5-carboxylate reductase